MMFGRAWSSGSSHRYGFGGQEQDNEVVGAGNSYTAEFWQYDPRIGRRWNLDPVTKYYGSNYAAFLNNPIFYTDILGNYEDGPGGRRAMKRAERVVKKLEKQGYAATIDDKVNNDGVWNVTYLKSERYNDDYKTGGLVEYSVDVKLNIWNNWANKLALGDSWVHSDEGEQVGRDIADMFPGVSAGHIAQGISEGVDMYDNPMEGADYLTHGLNVIPSSGVASESVSVILGAAKTGIKFYNSKELARRLNTTARDYHKSIKPNMKKEFAKEMKELRTTNPDFTHDVNGNVVLRNQQTGETISTSVPFDKFKRQ